MDCPKCGAVNPSEKRFCLTCGNALAHSCPKCGSAVDPAASYCGDCGARLGIDERAAGVAQSSTPVRLVHDPERRYLTVLFCDVADSTRLAERLDPEELREVISSFFARCAEVVAKYDGYIADFQGDGVLVYFGYPQSYENNAERAVLAGLRMIESVADLNDELRTKGITLSVRIGIASGLVVAGDLVKEGVFDQRVVTGETPNLAARLQGIAELNTVVIAESTHQLIEGLFSYVDLGKRQLKGFSRELQVWRVVGPKPSESRFEALHAHGLTPLIGRDSEMLALRNCWDRTERGEPNVVLLIGEPGIGKSRLVRQLSTEVKPRAAIQLHYSSYPYSQNSVLQPFIDHIERSCELTRGDSPDAQLRKLESFLSRFDNVGSEQIVLFANLLSISLCGRYAPLDFGPQLQRERTMSALVDQIVARVRSQPVLMVVEDAHWLDITSQQQLQLLFERVGHLPIMVLVTSRSATYPSFAEALPITRLSLGRLGRSDAMAMLQQLTDSKMLPPEVLIDILEKTDGVPLFIEELTKTALETGLLQAAGDGYVLAKPTFALPATLHGSMTARLDSLGAAKEVAQVAAVIGREFSPELLCLVLQQPAARVDNALRQLEAVVILVRKSTDRETTYVFRHALLQSAAYETLLIARRRELHRRIVAAIEAQFLETAVRHPDLLAFHCARGGLPDKAIKYSQEAGLRAASRSAHIEAIAHFRGALDLLRSLPDTLKRDRVELEVQVALGSALLAARGYAVQEAVQAHQEIGRLCDKLGDSPETFPALFGQWIFFAGRAELAAAQNVASRLSRIAQGTEDGVTRAIAFHAAGISAFWNGEFEKARDQLAQAVEFGESHRNELFAHFQFRDRVLLSASYLSWSLFILGFPNQAFQNWNRIWEKFEERSDPYVQVIALTNACYLHQFSRDWKAVLKQASMVHSLASQRKFPVFITVSIILRGWALANSGELEAGMKDVRDGLEALRADGSSEDLPYLYALAAEVLAKGQQIQSALELVDAAIAEMERTGERWFMAELYRLRGDFLLLEPGGRDAEARASLECALTVAREQRAQTWQLRAATSLGRLMIRQGLADEAHGLVRPICDWFGSTCDLPDFADANALLSAR